MPIFQGFQRLGTQSPIRETRVLRSGVLICLILSELFRNTHTIQKVLPRGLF